MYTYIYTTVIVGRHLKNKLAGEVCCVRALAKTHLKPHRHMRLLVLLQLVTTCAGYTLAPLHHTNGMRRTLPPSCSLAEERIESGKAGAIAAVSGSLASAPAALLASSAFTPQWEFSTDALAVSLLLFGVVYRYAVRSDDNDQLKQGAVGAFALVRTLSSVRVDGQCTAIPLNCGAPLGYLDWDMLLQLGAYFGESALAFGGAAFAFEVCWSKGWAAKIPATGLPTEQDE